MNKVSVFFVIACILWLFNTKNQCNAGIINEGRNLYRNRLELVDKTTQNTIQLSKNTPVPEETDISGAIETGYIRYHRNRLELVNKTTQNTIQLSKTTPVPEDPVKGSDGEGGGKASGDGCGEIKGASCGGSGGGSGGGGGVVVESEWRCPEGQSFQFGACRKTDD